MQKEMRKGELDETLSGLTCRFRDQYLSCVKRIPVFKDSEQDLSQPCMVRWL